MCYVSPCCRDCRRWLCQDDYVEYDKNTITNKVFIPDDDDDDDDGNDDDNDDDADVEDDMPKLTNNNSSSNKGKGKSEPADGADIVHPVCVFAPPRVVT